MRSLKASMSSRANDVEEKMIETNGTCEPIKSHFSCDNKIYYTCSICGSILLKKQKICDHCGCEVIWK